MPDGQILRMVRRHGADRILFGSDAPWQKPAAVLAAFLNLPLREAEQRMILWENAARLLQLPVAERLAVPPPNPQTR
jgi:hypothetical protein